MVTTWVSRRHLICKVLVATALMAHKYPPRLRVEFCSTLLIVYLQYSLTHSSSWMNRVYTHHLIALAGKSAWSIWQMAKFEFMHLTTMSWWGIATYTPCLPTAKYSPSNW